MPSCYGNDSQGNEKGPDHESDHLFRPTESSSSDDDLFAPPADGDHGAARSKRVGIHGPKVMTPCARLQSCRRVTIANLGVIVVDELRRKLNAECSRCSCAGGVCVAPVATSCEDKHVRCHYDKSCDFNGRRKGQGRPLGLLIPWL